MPITIRHKLSPLSPCPTTSTQPIYPQAAPSKHHRTTLLNYLSHDYPEALFDKGLTGSEDSSVCIEEKNRVSLQKLFKHSSNRSKKDSCILNALHKGNRRIHRAWVLKDEFEHFWNYKAPSAAERFLKDWMTTALKSRLEPIRKFVQTIKNNIARIIPFVGSRLTNAIAEGLNRIIRIVKNRASGFRALRAFTDMIFLTVGDLDIPAQIPVKFRAL